MARTKSHSSNGEIADESRGKDGVNGIQSVSRALGILELFGAQRPALTASEIANLSGLNRATAYRFCQTLLSLGYLEETRPRTFRPGLKAVSLAQAALAAHELPDLARPYLSELRDATGETVNMALLDGAQIVYVSRLLNDSLLALRLFVGSRLPSTSSSMGRAMLAYLPDDEVERILDSGAVEAVTPKTITDRRRLMAELRRTRNRGYALNDEEIVLGVRGIAAPVFGVSGRPIAGINVSVAHELAPGEEKRLSTQVIEAADAISALAKQLAVDVG
ncbi:IclR family transcriptional regulator [Conexibacter sp. CPCC 206217]|uniref:IclR family transcriptional regulator n=1 Tax=Conexibacter sp. CPCC 206217 TaxID=3064574 RepID=UPI0027263E22|nr:IclR family transcriptional regulator [Conexibacter sp. CPCC 206217]MDO8209557.1 IclR family transcriptional regulator [Conexibacter sp. CPCC 206217]